MAGKKTFTVEENETIDQCLARMAKEGYMPVRRMEKPVFQEVKKNGRTDVETVRQQITFEGKKRES
ncbi:NETI motif-containing protein [Salisediminibacterium selenitireducens]|uniref:NETI motif-containing protein n=1 Tax=Bacillus selenitireducens (strain ATCC 700615 / DSM 15326 / MLS10) TaxID=439292 RepID=D6XYR4_BACIE|nr:NETI motif-containing protein [Salisediminibacterium selenitireducens]ADH98222.1 hypothetical protein Bsel_0687 [[Bacillus] selenitireducens MLS10]